MEKLAVIGAKIEAAVLAALAMLGLGFEAFIDFIPDDIGKLAGFLGCILTFILIALQYTTLQIRRMEKQKMDEE